MNMDFQRLRPLELYRPPHDQAVLHQTEERSWRAKALRVVFCSLASGLGIYLLVSSSLVVLIGIAFALLALLAIAAAVCIYAQNITM